MGDGDRQDAGVDPGGGLGARLVLFVVPTLDLAVQTALAWRRDGHLEHMVIVSSLDTAGRDGLVAARIMSTTDPHALGGLMSVVGESPDNGKLRLERAHSLMQQPWGRVVPRPVGGRCQWRGLRSSCPGMGLCALAWLYGWPGESGMARFPPLTGWHGGGPFRMEGRHQRRLFY
ncbi:hypothetical protein [Streptomyces sp. NPDC046859]|uniref:hypothetical protein n=1 Tax=Streptomyces sp. NPDC046859 TaxID=3155734 RepID=UPI0033EA6016